MLTFKVYAVLLAERETLNTAMAWKPNLKLMGQWFPRCFTRSCGLKFWVCTQVFPPTKSFVVSLDQIFPSPVTKEWHNYAAYLSLWDLHIKIFVTVGGLEAVVWVLFPEWMLDYGSNSVPIMIPNTWFSWSLNSNASVTGTVEVFLSSFENRSLNYWEISQGCLKFT